MMLFRLGRFGWGGRWRLTGIVGGLLRTGFRRWSSGITASGCGSAGTIGAQTFHGKNARHAVERVVGKAVVGAESVAFDNPVGTFDLDERVGVDDTVALVPKDLGSAEFVACEIGNRDVSVESPHLRDAEEIGGIAVDESVLHAHVVELFKVQVLRKPPKGFFRFLVHFPDGGGDAVADDAGVGNQRLDVARNDCGCRFGVEHVPHHVFLLVIACRHDCCRYD